MRWSKGAALLASVTLVVGWLACESSMSQPNTGGSTPNVSVGDNFFAPRVDTVAVGATVSWKNNGHEAHTSTSDTGAWDSNSVAAGGTFTHQFTQAGSFPYHCKFHGSAGSGMAGVIVVR